MFDGKLLERTGRNIIENNGLHYSFGKKEEHREVENLIREAIFGSLSEGAVSEAD